MKTVLCALAVAGGANAQWSNQPANKPGQDNNTFWTGTCESYDGVCNQVVGSRKVFVPTGFNRTFQEGVVIDTILEAHDLAVYLGTDACKIQTDAFACASLYAICDSTTAPEPVPSLPCVEFCHETWDKCRSGFTSYLALKLGNVNYLNSKLPNCGPNSTFPLTALPLGTTEIMAADRFGHRFLTPRDPVWPMGYKNQLKYPTEYANYTTSANVTYKINCSVPKTISAILDPYYKPTSAPVGNADALAAALTLVGAVASISAVVLF